eukprot:scaffold149_cov315-Pinguiococcus_pyrenoidosus.AAC.70
MASLAGFFREGNARSARNSYAHDVACARMVGKDVRGDQPAQGKATLAVSSAARFHALKSESNARTNAQAIKFGSQKVAAGESVFGAWKLAEPDSARASNAHSGAS